MTISGIDKSEGPSETKLGRGIRCIVDGECSMYDVGPESTFDDAKRVVVLVVYEKDGDI